ncbi:hypothetical protein R0K17_00010 [Planococcus sp. SIMBA_143]
MDTIIYDSSLIIAIIAINMTVIGLTSLAEMKKVIGIDYGNFLLKKYKIFGFLRIYYVLILFGIINVLGLFLFFIPIYSLRLTYFWLLVVSLIFAIYYFFAYIIVESNKVIKQIYEQEILGLYYNSDEPTTFKPDILTKVNDGSRTTKKMSGNFIEYFNTYSTDSNDAFAELLGPNSIIYAYTPRLNKKRSKKHNIDSPYIYRQSVYQTKELSHEFFQMYRYSKNQDRWILTALDLFDNLYAKDKFDYIRLCNFTRIIGQMNTYGTSSNLFKYKFLEHLFPYYKKAMYWTIPKLTTAETNAEIRALAFYTHEELIKFTFSTYHLYPELFYLQTIKKILLENVLQETQLLISPKDQLQQIAQQAALLDNEDLKNLVVEVFEKYQDYRGSNNLLPSISISEVRKSIKAGQQKKTQVNSALKQQLFS